MKGLIHAALPAVLPVVLVFAAPATAADDAALARCRTITTAADRLACYDAIPAPPAGGAAVRPAAAPPTPESRFGLPQRDAAEPQALETHIPGAFEGWGPTTRFRFANGQVWEIADGSSAFYQLKDPKVRVRRGMLGAFYLDIDGQNRSPRVRRVQ